MFQLYLALSLRVFDFVVVFLVNKASQTRDKQTYINTMHCNVLLTAAKTQTKFQTNLALLLRETVLMTVASILIRFYAQIRQTECRARKSSYH